MSDERYTVLLGERRYAIHRKWAKPEGQGFGFLSDLMVDGAGHVHVAQRGMDQPVLVFDRDGRQIGAWGEGTLAEPHYINASADGGILVADRDAHQVLRFDKDGKLVQALGKRHWPSLDAPFNHPTAAAESADGEIYVSDGYGNSNVHRFTRDGRLLGTWGQPGHGPGAFTTPHAIAVDSRGRVLVADRENDRVQVFDQNGKFIRQFGGFAPFGLFITPGDEMFATDGRAHHVHRLTLDGKILETWGKRGPEAGNFFLPHGITVGADGAVYVTEVDGKRVQKFVKAP